MVCSSLRRMVQSSSMAWSPFSWLFSILSHYFDKVKGGSPIFPLGVEKIFPSAGRTPLCTLSGGAAQLARSRSTAPFPLPADVVS